MSHNVKHPETLKTCIQALLTAALPVCEFHSSEIPLPSSSSPLALSHVKPHCYNKRVVILSAWLPSLLGAITAHHAWHRQKSRVCFCCVAGVQAVISVYLHGMKTRRGAHGSEEDIVSSCSCLSR